VILKMPALGMIWAYQQFISPRKGYRCAHSVVHGGTGCSGYAKRRIRDVGLLSAIPDVRQRFKDCSATARNVNERRRSDGTRSNRRRSKENPLLACMDICESCDGCDGLGS